MAVTAQNVKDCFSEFAGTDSNKVNKFRLQAESQINISEWGPSKADNGILYLTAHLLKLEKEGNSLAAGPIMSKRVGDVSVAFAIGELVKKSALSGTSYGRHFVQLRSLVWPGRVLA